MARRKEAFGDRREEAVTTFASMYPEESGAVVDMEKVEDAGEIYWRAFLPCLYCGLTADCGCGES